MNNNFIKNKKININELCNINIENLFKFKDRETFIKKNNLDELKKEIIQFKEDNTYILIEVKQFYEYFFKYANELQIKYDSSITS